MEFNQEETPQETGFKQWFQDNLRIIVSIVVVVIIALGIYSFSNRSVEIDKIGEGTEQSDILNDILDSNTSDSSMKEEDDNKSQNANIIPAGKETSESFIETAAKGDSKTKLARRALADYLEKNPDASITKEQKIYIEDYLRKNVSTEGGVKIGTTMEFSKSLIQDAISRSKDLNENQLNNLHKYVILVPSLQ